MNSATAPTVARKTCGPVRPARHARTARAQVLEALGAAVRVQRLDDRPLARRRGAPRG